MSKIACPDCEQIDSVQKVSSIVKTQITTTDGTQTESVQLESKGSYRRSGDFLASGRSTGKTTGSVSTRISKTESTELAYDVGAPPKPRGPGSPPSALKDKPSRVSTGCLSLVVSILLFSCVVIRPIVMSRPDVVIDERSTFFFGIVAIIIFIGAFFFVYRFFWKRAKQKHKQAVADREQSTINYGEELATHKANVTRWEMAMNRWNQMYYCNRCDGVYVPGDGLEVVPSNKSDALAYHGV